MCTVSRIEHQYSQISLTLVLLHLPNALNRTALATPAAQNMARGRSLWIEIKDNSIIQTIRPVLPVPALQRSAVRRVYPRISARASYQQSQRNNGNCIHISYSAASREHSQNFAKKYIKLREKAGAIFCIIKQIKNFKHIHM